MSSPESRVSDAQSGTQGLHGKPSPSRRQGKVYWLVATCLGLALAALGVIQSGGEPRNTAPKTAVPDPTTPKLQFPVKINRPPGPRLIATGTTNFQGQPVMASCSACHTTTQPNLSTHCTEDLDQFHQGLKYNHGNLTCLSCHNSNDYETLRLADGRALDFSDSMTLCSQCHGPQRRDYDQGLHGGMNGHWDLTRGGRTRNTCIDCHDPHSPAFPMVLPVLPPRDRISVPARHAADTVSHAASLP